MNIIAQPLYLPVYMAFARDTREKRMISLTTHKTISNGELAVFNKNEHCVAGST